MTKAEAKAVLGKDAHLETGPESPDADKAKPICDLTLSVNIESVHGTANMCFDRATKRLSNIMIWLPIKALDDRTRQIFNTSLIVKALQNKYGEPFRTEEDEYENDITWRAKDQLIQCLITKVGGVPYLIAILYGPMSGIKDL